MQVADLVRAAREPLARIPAGVKFSGSEKGFRALGHRQLRVENRAANLQMRVERFARDKKPHDLARSFEDKIDAAIAQKTFDRDRLLSPAGAGFGGLAIADR